MPKDSKTSPQYRLPSLTDRGALVRLAMIGAAVASVAGCFAYVAGNAGAADRHLRAGQRHLFRLPPQSCQGVCIAGYFESNGQGARLSKAVVFQPGRVPVIGRFALAGGQPYMADGPKAVRSMALSFRPRDAEEWRTGMNDIPVFAVRTAEAFNEQLLASKPDPATGKPDPAKMKPFLAAHPETARAIQLINAKPFSSGFANATYNSLDAFRFVNAAGASMPVRWSMVTAEPFEPEAPDQATAQDKNYLFDALIARVE